jgi:hypothetical protein
MQMAAVASASRCQRNFMYQANINPRIGEVLTRAQAIEAFDVLGRNLRLDGHQRVIVQHEKLGRRHFHAIWNRVDIETLKVTDIGGNYRVHEATARELEARFGLEPTPRPAGPRERSPELWELRAAARSGIKIDDLKAELTRLWHGTDSGQAFKAALEARGYILARGDRRDFCVVDRAGTAHSLAKRLDGVRTKELRVRMADVDREGLPSVAEARAEQRRRAAARQAQAQRSKPSGARGAARQVNPRHILGRRAGRRPHRSWIIRGPRPGLIRRGLRLAQGPPLRTVRPTDTRSSPQSAWRAASSRVQRRDGPRIGASWHGPASSVGTTARYGSGRAGAAYAHEFAKWQAQIDAALTDRSLSSDQRDAAILSLRRRQQIEAVGARRRVLEEEAQSAEAERRKQQSPGVPHRRDRTGACSPNGLRS